VRPWTSAEAAMRTSASPIGSPRRRSSALNNRVLGLQPAKDLVSRDDRETEGSVLGQVVARFGEDGRRTPHDCREGVRVQESPGKGHYEVGLVKKCDLSSAIRSMSSISSGRRPR
jgi:hypothetical protein